MIRNRFWRNFGWKMKNIFHSLAMWMVFWIVLPFLPACFLISLVIVIVQLCLFTDAGLANQTVASILKLAFSNFKEFLWNLPFFTKF